MRSHLWCIFSVGDDVLLLNTETGPSASHRNQTTQQKLKWTNSCITKHDGYVGERCLCHITTRKQMKEINYILHKENQAYKHKDYFFIDLFIFWKLSSFPWSFLMTLMCPYLLLMSLGFSLFIMILSISQLDF